MNQITEIEYLKQIVCGIVEYPADVEVEKKTDEMGVLLTLKVNPRDMGIVIGRGGETVRVIRKLIYVFGGRTKAKISLNIWDPREQTRDHSEELEGIKPSIRRKTIDDY